MVVLRSLLVIAALTSAGAAQAHVAVQPTAVPAGSYQVLRFGVGHGCDGKATTAIRIEMPAGLASARPQPKPGWRLSIEHSADKAVTAITWRGQLPADQFDELLIQVKLPSTAGPLPFAAIQTCGATQVRWDEPIPANGARPKHPAPTLSLTPAAPPAGSGYDHHQ